MDTCSEEKNEYKTFQTLVQNFNQDVLNNDFYLFPNQFNKQICDAYNTQEVPSQEYFNNIDPSNLNLFSPSISNDIECINSIIPFYSSPLDSTQFNQNFHWNQYLTQDQILSNNHNFNDFLSSDFNLYESFGYSVFSTSTPLISRFSSFSNDDFSIKNEYNNKNNFIQDEIIEESFKDFIQSINPVLPIKEKKKVGRKKNKQSEFPCEKCGKIFKRAFNLKIHSETHDEVRVRNHSCSICPRKFTRKHDLTRHLLNVHNSKA